VVASVFLGEFFLKPNSLQLNFSPRLAKGRRAIRRRNAAVYPRQSSLEA